jgi:hypothetical protein
MSVKIWHCTLCHWMYTCYIKIKKCLNCITYSENSIQRDNKWSDSNPANRKAHLPLIPHTSHLSTLFWQMAHTSGYQNYIYVCTIHKQLHLSIHIQLPSLHTTHVPISYVSLLTLFISYSFQNVNTGVIINE